MTLSIPPPWVRPSHSEQRAMVAEACRVELGAEVAGPVPVGMLELIQAMTGHETVYACPDNPPVWVGSCNHGAYQHKFPSCQSARREGQPWSPMGGCFLARDTHPNADGTSTSYGVCFRSYPSHLDGIRDVVRWVKRHPRTLAAARTGVPQAFSTALRQDGYYEGFGKTQEERIANHCKSITKWVAAIRKGLAAPSAPCEWPSTTIELVGFTWQTLLDEAEGDMRRERDALIAGE